MASPKPNTDKAAGLLETKTVVALKQHHLPALKSITRALELESCESAAIWALAYAACHPARIVAFATQMDQYADAEGMDLDQLINARIHEARKPQRRTV